MMLHSIYNPASHYNVMCSFCSGFTCNLKVNNETVTSMENKKIRENFGLHLNWLLKSNRHLSIHNCFTLKKR
jgi:hypothetical protein